MSSVRALRHRRHQKRRLFAGAVQKAYNSELHLRRLEAGRIKHRRLFAGQTELAYQRELRAQRLEQGRGAPRREFSRHLSGEFSGFVKNPRVPRRSR